MKKALALIFFYLVLKSNNCLSFIYIISVVNENPEYIELQYKCLTKFLKDDFKYVLFIDLNENERDKLINNFCNKYNIKYYLVPSSIYYTGWEAFNEFIKNHHFYKMFKHGQILGYAFKSICDHKGIAVFMRPNIFLTKDFSIKEYINNNNICGKKTKVKNVPSSDLFAFNLSTLQNFQTMRLESSFLGFKPRKPLGLLQFYFEDYPETKIRWMKNDNINSLNLNQMRHFTSAQIDFINGYFNIYKNLNLTKKSENSEFLANAFFVFRNQNLSSILGQKLNEYLKLKFLAMSAQRRGNF